MDFFYFHVQPSCFLSHVSAMRNYILKLSGGCDGPAAPPCIRPLEANYLTTSKDFFRFRVFLEELLKYLKILNEKITHFFQKRIYEGFMGLSNSPSPRILGVIPRPPPQNLGDIIFDPIQKRDLQNSSNLAPFSVHDYHYKWN